MKIAKMVANFENLNLTQPVTGEAEASTVRAAVSRALAKVLKSPELKSKRLTVFNLSVDITNKV